MDKNTWAMILHFSVFAGCIIPFAGLLVPILIWQLKKAEMPELDPHGKVVVNFLISMAIYFAVSFVLSFLFIGIPLMIGLGIVGFVFPIIGGIKANNGELWKYPLMIQFFK